MYVAVTEHMTEEKRCEFDASLRPALPPVSRAQTFATERERVAAMERRIAIAHGRVES